MMPPYMIMSVKEETTCPALYERACETGPTAYRPYPRRLESQTVCRCYYKGSTFSSFI